MHVYALNHDKCILIIRLVKLIPLIQHSGQEGIDIIKRP